jgi:hypothetical protein
MTRSFAFRMEQLRNSFERGSQRFCCSTKISAVDSKWLKWNRYSDHPVLHVGARVLFPAITRCDLRGTALKDKPALHFL